MAFRDFLSPGDVHYIIDIVNRKRDIYEITFGEPPRYIKMPSMIFRFFSEVKPFRVVNESNGQYKFLGLIACPTNSIGRIEEIEVF